MNLRAACVPLIVAVLATSCDQHLPFTPNIEIQRGNPSASARVGRTASSEGTRHVEGGAGPGALYALDVPENWNGDLVVYAHGYTEESGAPVALPNIAYLRDPLLRRGFAFATSSFSTNGYALKEGFLQTHQLGGLFATKFGPPLSDADRRRPAWQRTYLEDQGILEREERRAYDVHTGYSVTRAAIRTSPRRTRLGSFETWH